MTTAAALGGLAAVVAWGRVGSAPDPVAPLDWDFTVSDIQGAEGGLSSCEAPGPCVPVAAGSVLAPGAVIRADRGVRATLSLMGATGKTTLILEDRAIVTLAAETAPTVRVHRGEVTLDRASDPGEIARDVNVVWSGAWATSRGGPLHATIRAADQRASYAVHRGRMSVSVGDAEALDLRSGERLRVGDEGAVREALWQIDPHEDGRDARNEEQNEGQNRAANDRRGLGRMTARVPGTSDEVSGVRLASHHVSAEIEAGFARTTIEEAFENETLQTLEGKLVFPIPPDATISRLALWVDDTLVEGEIVEKPLARRVFRAIVDDTVRPRDPALLEFVGGSSVSLKVFPIPPKGRRKVLIAYDQALRDADRAVRYLYPLSLGPDRATPIDDFSISVVVRDGHAIPGTCETDGYSASIEANGEGVHATYSAKGFVPRADFVVRYDRERNAPAPLGWAVRPAGSAAALPDEPLAGHFAVRLRAEAPASAARPTPSRSARAIVIDTSHSQSTVTIDAAVRVAKRAIGSLDPDDRFVVLACDSACASYPEDGLAAASDETIAEAGLWLSRQGPAGSSDFVGALAAAARVVPEGGQIVYLGDGAATSGELDPKAIGDRVAPLLRGRDVRFVGVGHSVDELVLTAIASRVAATYERLANGDAVGARVDAIARSLDAPVVRNARLTLPEGAFEVYPAKLPALPMGSEVIVVGRLDPRQKEASAGADAVTVPAAFHEAEAPAIDGGPMGEARITGTVDGAPYEAVRALDWDAALAKPQPATAALWARAKIAALETSGDADPKRIVHLSTRYHVLTRATALLVLENEQMFAETGIRAAVTRSLQMGEPDSDARAKGTRIVGKEFGMIGLLGAAGTSGAPTAPWGSSGAEDPMSARGNMWGDALGDKFGAGGLGLSGVGEGGAGRGEGIGLGSIGTMGHGAGTGTGSGFGSGRSLSSGSHSTSAPKVRMGATSVSGRIPPEVVQRIVRRNFGRFRMCYENGLRSNPNLTGRVSVRFVIDRLGNATSVGNGGSDLPDSSVVSCVVSAFRGLVFPAPEDGIVKVVYPIMFAPSDGSPAPRPSSWSPPAWSGPAWSGPAAPSATHRAPAIDGTDPQNKSADPEISRLFAEASAPEVPRATYGKLVRALLGRGRADEAFAAAARYRGLDPDHAGALELYAAAAAATGRGREALLAIDAQAEIDARNPDRHRRAAKAFEAAGDERRACAHWRSLSALSASDEGAMYEALRCRGRLGERDGALSEARTFVREHGAPKAAPSAKPSKTVAWLADALSKGGAPAFDLPEIQGGSFEARIVCSDDSSACPVPIVIAPNGGVHGAWLPGTTASRSAVSIASPMSGSYRTVVTGVVPSQGASLIVRALGQSRTIPLNRAGTYTAAVSAISLGETSF